MPRNYIPHWVLGAPRKERSDKGKPRPGRAANAGRRSDYRGRKQTTVTLSVPAADWLERRGAGRDARVSRSFVLARALAAAYGSPAAEAPAYLRAARARVPRIKVSISIAPDWAAWAQRNGVALGAAIESAIVLDMLKG